MITATPLKNELVEEVTANVVIEAQAEATHVKPAPLHPFLSKKFRFYSFLSMVLLVFVHGYNLNDRYLQPFTITDERMRFNGFFQYFLANGLFRFRIPMLFVISGYLFALHDQTPHWQRIKKRARTVLLPYFLWSIIGLAVAVLLTNWPITRDAVYNGHLQPYSKPFSSYTPNNWITALIWPTSFQLWFLRCLFMYNVLYPLLLKGVMKRPAVIFTIFSILWILTFGFVLVEGEGLLFFSLGIWLCKKGKDVMNKPKWLNMPVMLAVFLGVAAIKTWFAFHTSMQQQYMFPILMLLHKIVIFSGLLVVWFGCDKMVKYFMEQKWFINLSSYSFIIYALHVPLVTYLIDPTFSLLNGFPHYRLLTFILLPLALIAFCISVGWIMRKTVPAVYGTLTGGRGL